MTQISENYKKIVRTIEIATQKANRSIHPVKLLAVTKGEAFQSILELAKEGQKTFAENYVQEWRRKKGDLSNFPIQWHFTGRVQTNKVKYLVGEIELFHSIDRLELAEKINQIAEKQNIVCKGLIEINLAEEKTKGGIHEKNLTNLFEKLNQSDYLTILGLMILPPYSENPESSRPYFKQLREILFDLNQKSIYKTPLTELSMGTSHDFQVAIEEGATWVRIGRALFQKDE